MTRDNRTEVTKVNSASVISGQYLPTADDNALLTRSILLSFARKVYSQQELARYDELKKLEKTGLSSLVGDILRYRKDIDKSFGMVFSELMERQQLNIVCAKTAQRFGKTGLVRRAVVISRNHRNANDDWRRSPKRRGDVS